MKAIIMAGGEGSRLRPLTCRRPKPLVPVANRPVMEYCVDLLRDLGIKEVGVTLQYLPAMIEEYFGDGSDFGLRLHYFVEGKPLGTAGSVKNAAAILDETFIVISGDALTDFDLRPALERHRESGALATLVLTTVDNPLEYGVVITNDDGSIRSFLEKPSWGEVFSDRVNTGIYILEPEVLEQVPEGQSYDFSKDLFPELLKARKPLYGVTLDGYWCDIGNLSQYRQAQEDILHGHVRVKVVGADRGNGVVVGEGTEIDPEAKLQGPVMIGGYCRIGPGAVVGPSTVLGPNTQVDAGASLKKTIVWDNAYIGAGASLRGAVVCSGARISKQVQVFEDAVIGDACRVEAGAEVRQEVKVWPQKCLGQETVLSESLIWGRGTTRPLFAGSQIAGYLNDALAPSRVIRLGLAYGSSFKPGTVVGLSTFNDGVGELLYKAMAAGLMTAGVKVADLGCLITPLHRFAVRYLALAGGCHIKPDAAETGRVRLHMVNERGHDLPPGSVRKIENYYWREDGRQAGSVQTSIVFPAVKAAYQKWLLSTLRQDGLKKRPLRIALGSQRLAADLAAEILQQAGADVIRLDFDPARDWQAAQEHIPYFAAEIQRYGADMGAVIDPNGEELMLFYNSGQRVTPAQQLALLARIYLELKEGVNLVLPVTAPRALELVAGQMGGRVERVKNHPGTYQEAMARVDGDDLLGQQHLQLDALAALVHILDWLARRRLNLAAAVAELPPIHTALRTVPCPWEAKGRVMRNLITQEPAEQVELLDGVQVRAEDGWTLVLPDGETPHYRIYSEAFSQEAAEELAVRYEKRLQELIEKA